MALSKHGCYVMEFEDVWGHLKQYHGISEIRLGQTSEAAFGIRLRHHKLKPLQCLLLCKWDTARIKACGRALSLANALAQEVINPARALGHDTSARGACYSCKELNGFLRNSAFAVRRAVGTLEGQAARDAVTRYSETLHEDHPLRKHLANEKYSKKVGTWERMPPQLVHLLTKRSGKPGCQTRKLQIKQGKYQRGDEDHVRLKRGQNPAENRKAEYARRSKPQPGATKRQKL